MSIYRNYGKKRPQQTSNNIAIIWGHGLYKLYRYNIKFTILKLIFTCENQLKDEFQFQQSAMGHGTLQSGTLPLYKKHL